MTEEELAVIEARWEKATPGEWVLSDVYWKHVPDQWYRRICRATSNGKPSICDVALMPYIHPAGELASRRDPQAELDFEAIAHARTDIPALVAEVRRLRGRYETYKGNFLNQVQINKEIFAENERLRGLLVRLQDAAEPDNDNWNRDLNEILEESLALTAESSRAEHHERKPCPNCGSTLDSSPGQHECGRCTLL